MVAVATMQDGLGDQLVVKPYAKYGLCLMCERWVPRDDMLAANVSLFDRANNEKKIRLRCCPECHTDADASFTKLEWKNDLRTLSELNMAGIRPAKLALGPAPVEPVESFVATGEDEDGDDPE